MTVEQRKRKGCRETEKEGECNGEIYKKEKRDERKRKKTRTKTYIRRKEEKDWDR